MNQFSILWSDDGDAQPDGTLWVSDGRGGVTRINPDGSQQFFGGMVSSTCLFLYRIPGLPAHSSAASRHADISAPHGSSPKR